jgi:hypothetical protein
MNFGGRMATTGASMQHNIKREDLMVLAFLNWRRARMTACLIDKNRCALCITAELPVALHVENCLRRSSNAALSGQYEAQQFAE